VANSACQLLRGLVSPPITAVTMHLDSWRALLAALQHEATYIAQGSLQVLALKAESGAGS
jgi:hypothetical protein